MLAKNLKFVMENLTKMYFLNAMDFYLAGQSVRLLILQFIGKNWSNSTINPKNY